MFTAGELLALIEEIYAGILDQAAWEAAIARLCRALGGEAAALSLHDARSNAVLSVDFVNIDAGYRRSYGELANLPDMAGAYRAVTAARWRGVTGEDLVAAPQIRAIALPRRVAQAASCSGHDCRSILATRP